MQSKGKGSIVALEPKPRGKCRRWQLRVSVGKNPHTGKYQVKTRRLTGTYTEAVHALDEFKSELCEMAYTRPESPTVSELARDYTEARLHGAKGTRRVSKSSADKDRWNIAAFLKVSGDMKVSDLDASAVRDAFSRLQDAGKGGTYLRGVYVTMRGLFAFALEQGFVTANPMDRVTAPKADTKPRRALEQPRLSALLRSLDPTDRMEFAVLMLATTGLRRGELCAARFGDVDGRTLRVRSSKTTTGLRDVPLGAVTVDAIEARREALNAVSSANGLEVGSDTPLLSDEVGHAPTPHHLGVWWQKHRADYGLEGWTLHELRHSFISLLSESGASVAAMQALAGHASPQTTLKVYTHAGSREKREAVEGALNMLWCEGNDR